MKRILYITLALLLPLLSMAEEQILSRPSKYLDRWNNYYWQFTSRDGLYRWQFDFDSKTTDLPDSTYTMAGKAFGNGYTYGFYTKDSLTRIEIQDLSVTIFHDEHGMEHVSATVKGGNEKLGMQQYELMYWEEAPIGNDTVVVVADYADFVDYCAMYDNMRFTGASDGYEVSVTVYTKVIEGHYTWDQAASIGSEVVMLRTGVRAPISEMDVTVTATEEGYLMEGYVLADHTWYAIRLNYRPKPTYHKEYISIVDYDWHLTEEQNILMTLRSEEAEYALTILTSDIEYRHRYTMTATTLMTDYVDADVWMYHNDETGTDVFTIEGSLYTEDFRQLVLTYAGEEKPIEGKNVEELPTIKTKNEVRKRLINNDLVIENLGRKYNVLGIGL